MFFLQIPTFLERATEVSQTISEQWNSTWTLFLGDGTPGTSVLFNKMTQLGFTFAAGALLVYMYQIATEVYSSKEPLIDPKIFVRPLLIALLLFNNGGLLKQVIIGMHTALNEINQQVLTITYTGAELDEAYNAAKNMGNVQTLINRYVEECAGTVGEQQVQCLNNALDRSVSLVEQMRDKYGIGWFQQVLDDLNELKNSILDDAVPFFVADNIYWAVAGPGWEQVAYGALWAWQSGFQHAVETVILFTAIFSPLAVGGGLIPSRGGGSIGLSFTGFFSIHLMKLGFNIMTGIAAIFFINTPIGDPLVFPIITAIFAPFFGILIMTGGAMGLWKGIVSLGEKGLQLGLKALPV